MSPRILRMGRDLQSRLKIFFDPPLASGAVPLELLHAVLDDLEARVQPAGRGRRIFPYNTIAITIAQPGSDEAAMRAVFADLELRLRERLAEVRCESPGPLAITMTCEAGDVEPGVKVVCSSATLEEDAPSPTPAPVPARPVVRLAVIKGQCAEAEYLLDEPAIAIGRTADPTDAYGQVRHNHVAFVETRDGISETVGRAHARLQFDDASGHYYLFNEASSNPTSILRAGRTIRVAPRDPRGVRVQSGDQLQLGRAVLRLALE